MAKRVAHIIVSSLLSFLLLFGSTTMSFVHSFTDHEDTADLRAAHEGPAIESQHHHCAFLGFALAPFANDSETPVILLHHISHYPRYNSSYQFNRLQQYGEQLLLRGPPANV